jgi:hypothetical protein
MPPTLLPCVQHSAQLVPSSKDSLRRQEARETSVIPQVLPRIKYVYKSFDSHICAIKRAHICKKSSQMRFDNISTIYFSRFGIKPCGYYRGRSAIQQRSGRSAADTAASVRVQSYHGHPRGPTRGSPPSGYSRWHLLWATSGIGSSDELPQLLLPGPAAKFPAAASTADHAPE